MFALVVVGGVCCWRTSVSGWRSVLVVTGVRELREDSVRKWERHSAKPVTLWGQARAVGAVICLCYKDLRDVDVDGVKIAARQPKTRKNCGALSALLPSKKTRREGTSGTTLARLSSPQSFRIQKC